MELIHFHYIPEAGLTVLIGCGVGLLIKLHIEVTSSYHMEELATFDEGTFALVLLPIIIFDAGFGAKKARFFGNIGPICIMALVGTTISTVFVGSCLKILGDIGLSEVDMGWAEALTFGALISAVDPVATLAVFGALKVEPNLNYRVFGESIINDAVSIVLFRVFGKFMIQKVDSSSLLAAVRMFFTLSLGSIFLGLLVAMLMSLVLKICHIHDPLLAAGTFILGSYISYELTEAVHWSGIIASLFCGFGMKHYALNNIAEQYQGMVLDMVHMFASMSDLVIFFMVGENVILFAPYDKFWHIFWTIILIIIGRMLNVFPLSALYNLCQKNKTATLSLSPVDKNNSDGKYVVMSIDGESFACAFDKVSDGPGRDPTGVLIGESQITEIDGEPKEPNTLNRILGYTVTSLGGEPVDTDSISKASDGTATELEISYDPRIPFPDQLIMVHSGLRGAIAFALALGFPSQHKVTVIKTTTWVRSKQFKRHHYFVWHSNRGYTV